MKDNKRFTSIERGEHTPGEWKMMMDDLRMKARADELPGSAIAALAILERLEEVARSDKKTSQKQSEAWKVLRIGDIQDKEIYERKSAMICACMNAYITQRGLTVDKAAEEIANLADMDDRSIRNLYFKHRSPFYRSMGDEPIPPEFFHPFIQAERE